MSDLIDINSTEPVKIIGSDATGVEQTPVQSTSTGSLHSNLRNTAGTEVGTSSTPLRIDPTGTTIQPVSGTVTANAGTNLNTSTLALETGGNLASLNSKVTVVNTGAVVVSSSALPTGAATAAKQPALGTAGTASSDVITVQGATSMTALKVDGSATTQPVSGTVTANAGTNLNTSALALDATLTGGNAKAVNRGGAKGTTTAADVTSTASGVNHQTLDVAIYDASGNQITSFGGGTQFADGAPRGTATGTLAMGDDGTNIQSISVDTTGKLNLNNISGTVSLPTGAATSTNQATQITSLQNLDTKTPPLGQALAAASTPVVLTAAQVSTLTPLSTIAVTQATGTNLHTTVDNFPASQPVTGTVTANAGTNLNTSALALDATVAKDSSLGTLNTSVNTLLKPASTLAAVTAITNTVTIKADTAINQTNSLKVDGSAVTQPISATALPLPTGAATSANQTTGNSTLSSISGQLPTTLGAKTTANSMAVNIASDQTIPVSGTGNFTVVQTTGTNLHTVVDSGNLTVTQGTAANLNAQVQGTTASGLVKSGNPVQIGHVFNSTQPIVTTGQVVEAQASARGALIVSTGVDSFNVNNVSGTVSLPTGAATLVEQQTQTSTLLAISKPLGSVTGGIAGTSSFLNGAVFTSTLPTLTTGQQVSLQTDLNGRLLTANVNSDGRKITYSASISGLVAAALPTDIFTITGSATKTVKISRLYLTATQGTAGQKDVLLIKRSTANTLGTSTAPTGIPYDSTNAAATATVLAYTANPTLGTAVGTLFSTKLQIPTAATSGDALALNFGTSNAQAITLRGIAQVLAVNLNAATLTTSSFDITIEWTEES